MKKLGMFLGCGVLALAIGCGDGGAPSNNAGAPPEMPDPAKMAEMMKGKDMAVPPGDGAKAEGEKKEGDAAAEKKEGDAPAEKKEGDAPAEKKDGEAAAEKKDEKKE